MSSENVSQSKGPDQEARKAGIEMGTKMTSEECPLPGVTKEHSVWDVYNNEARKVDIELVKDWTANLNSLLLFAAIFAAVLTAFVIESKKLLTQDPAYVMVDVMIFFANNRANATRPLYVQSPFEVPWPAVTINCLFFASLSTSLVAALASVVALQWVTDYDAATTRGGSYPEERAKRRQFRYTGLLWWRMSDIIAGVPLLLYSSVALFFSGLILWTWDTNHAVGLAVTGGAAAAVLFYGGSTLLAVLSVSAPFRTPLSRAIYSLSHLPFSVLYFLAGSWLSLLVHLGNMIWREAGFTRGEDPLYLWIKEGHLKGIHFNKREDRRVEKEPKLGLDAIMWLANQLSISQVSFARLLLLVTELPKLKREISLVSGFAETSPWLSIFDLLGRECLKKDPNEGITTTEMRIASILGQCYSIPKMKEIIDLTAEMEYQRDGRHDGWGKRYFPKLRLGKLIRIPIPTRVTEVLLWRPNNLVLFLREVAPLSDNNAGALEAAIRRSRWRNWYEDPVHWTETFDLANSSPSNISKESIEVLSQYLYVANPGWWAGMATYLMNKYQGPYLSSILEMQASAWPFNFDEDNIYRRARKEPSLLNYMQRISKHVYPIICYEHDSFGGHLLFQMFVQVPLCQFPAEVEVFNAFPVKGRRFNALLMMLALSYEHEERSSEILLQHIHQQSLDRASALLKTVKGSQVANLALLIGICMQLKWRTLLHTDHICSEDVAMLSLCIRKALALAPEQRSSILICPLIKRVQEINDLMIAANHRSTEENEAASLAVTEVVNRLKSHLATLRIVGRQNCQALLCSRTHQAYSPAIGWLPPYID